MALVTIDNLDELRLLAEQLIAEIYAESPYNAWSLLDIETTLLVALMAEILSPEEALVVVAGLLQQKVAEGDLKDQTVRKALQQASRLVKFQRARRPVDDVFEITHNDVIAFINAPVLGKELQAPQNTTRDNRRWGADTFFTTLREVGLYTGDPLLDVAPFPRDPVPYRPLLDHEIALGDRFSARTTRDTRGPAGWALARATGTTSEIGAVELADARARRGFVWMSGGARNVARWAPVDEWEQEQIDRRAHELRHASESTRLVYEGSDGSDESKQASSCDVVHETLGRAGLRRDRRVRPLSVPAWRGVQVFNEVGNIEEVTQRLGVRSLDQAYRIIVIPYGRCDVPPAHRSRGHG